MRLGTWCKGKTFDENLYSGPDASFLLLALKMGPFAWNIPTPAFTVTKMRSFLLTASLEDLA